MILDLQFRIKSNPRYIEYLREHSYWYKFLNRNPNSFVAFEDEVKSFYKLRTSDKIGKMLSNIELIQNIVSSLK